MTAQVKNEKKINSESKKNKKTPVLALYLENPAKQNLYEEFLDLMESADKEPVEV